LKFEGTVDDEDESESDAKPEEVSDKKISIAWIDLTLRNTEKTFSKEKIIFKQLNGSFDFGSLNALMGPLGAGKTSLLRCLNGRYSNQMSDETKIYLSKFEKIRKCFISQDVSEHLLKGLTVKQAMIYASKLKNSDRELNHENNVNVLMNDLLISDVKDTNIENCSAGEQKQLVIAMELTSYLKPNLVCIDEPTSGLETNAAETVIKRLKVLSRMHSISIITSILQPNSDVLMMFDKLFVLSKGGVCVYSGSPKDMKNHLNECQIFCTECQKPIEVIMKIACKESDDNHVIKLSQKVSEEKETLLMRCSNETQLSLDGIQSRSRRFKFIDFWYLLLRTTIYTYKHYWELISGQFVVLVSIGFLFKYFFNPEIGKPNGCISFENFNNTCNKTKDQIIEDILLTQNITYNFLVVTFIMFLMLVTTTMTFTTEVRVFLLERRNGVFQFH
jgi:ABC-type multidrug transport system ATPase subunit